MSSGSRSNINRDGNLCGPLKASAPLVVSLNYKFSESQLSNKLRRPTFGKSNNGPRRSGVADQSKGHMLTAEETAPDGDKKLISIDLWATATGGKASALLNLRTEQYPPHITDG